MKINNLEDLLSIALIGISAFIVTAFFFYGLWNILIFP